MLINNVSVLGMVYSYSKSLSLWFQVIKIILFREKCISKIKLLEIQMATDHKQNVN